MTQSTSPPETLHASCIAIGDCAVLLSGRSGSGKSDLALRLIDRGAILVSDDYTMVWQVGKILLATAPAAIKGKIEVRGIGILQFDTMNDVPIRLFVDLNRDVERLPLKQETIRIADVDIPLIAANAHEASAPIKIEAALRHFGFVL